MELTLNDSETSQNVYSCDIGSLSKQQIIESQCLTLRKHQLVNLLGGGGAKTPTVVFASFQGVSNSVIANFKLPIVKRPAHKIPNI